MNRSPFRSLPVDKWLRMYPCDRKPERIHPSPNSLS
jgi:hypothetical protein